MIVLFNWVMLSFKLLTFQGVFLGLPCSSLTLQSGGEDVTSDFFGSANICSHVHQFPFTGGTCTILMLGCNFVVNPGCLFSSYKMMD